MRYGTKATEMSTTLAAGLLAAVVGICLVSSTHHAFAGCNPDDVTRTVVEEIAPGIFVRPGVHETMSGENNGGIANIGFVLGADAVAVIDTGGSACDGQRLRAAIRSRTDLPIRFVINTHVHPDHVFGNAAFQQDSPRFIGHRQLPRAIAARGAHYLTANRTIMGADALAGTEIIAPNLTVDDRMELDLGGRTLELTAHQVGHTDNDLTVFDVMTGTLWTGDLVFQGHLPVIDGSLKGWLTVMDELSRIPANRAIPGHGPVSIPWPAGLQPQKQYLTMLIQDLRRLIAEGRTMNHAIEIAARSERSAWKLFDEFNPRNASAGFAELEWE